MFDRDDPLDDARDREPEGLDRHRGGRGPTEEREGSVDPRDVFMRELDRPRDRERQGISLRDRSYEFRGSESRTIADFRAPFGERRDGLGVRRRWFGRAEGQAVRWSALTNSRPDIGCGKGRPSRS
jgi:hypothetical protein